MSVTAELKRLPCRGGQPPRAPLLFRSSPPVKLVSDDDDDGPMIPEPTGVKKSTVNRFSGFAHGEDEEPGGWTKAGSAKTASEIRRDARKGAAHLAREKASKASKKKKLI